MRLEEPLALPHQVDTPSIMSTAESWNIVPEDDAALGAELRRHGVEAGREYRVVTTPNDRTAEVESAPRRRLRSTGMMSEPGDLSSRTDEYLANGFGGD
jgi:hypothetical protein